MTLPEAHIFIGKLVFSTDAGHKMVNSTIKHGPYKLLKVTKAGYCILEGREEFRVPPSKISLAEK